MGIRIWVKKSVDQMDGRNGGGLLMPAFGGKVVRTESEIKELQKRAREEHFERTNRRHTHKVRDPKTGKEERITIEGRGWDIGEVHTLGSEPYKVPDMGKMARDDVMARIRKERAERRR